MRLTAAAERRSLLRFRALLEAQGYSVHILRMDTQQHGLPHYRARAYAVGIHRTVVGVAFQAPAPVTCPPATDLLDPLCEQDSSGKEPTREGALHAYQTALSRMPSPPPAEWFVDTYLSRKRVDACRALPLR